MCGIAGIISFAGRRPAGRELESMLAEMVHRGPDDAHVWAAGAAALGARRLAIVDPPGGAQPLANESGTVQVVFNGEIYNHAQLRRQLGHRGHVLPSHTDGAVLPHLYEEHGSDMFARLDGIFAVAVWDAAAQTLLLARDHLGVKPLYVLRRGQEIRFASEIRALLSDPSVPRELDLEGLDQHLTFRFTPAPRTLLAGVEKLEPATLLRCSRERCERVRYWRASPPPSTGASFGHAAELFRERLRDAVHRQMMSDRPIGAMLSGGVDSAAIVALMAERGPTVRTFTVGFEGGGDADETSLARETANLFGTQHEELMLGAADMAAELPQVIAMLEEPVATSSAIGVLAVSRVAARHVPVLLSGQGADELLGGYWRYLGEWLAAGVGRLPGPAPRLLASASRLAGWSRGARLERGLRALGQPRVEDRFLDIYAVFTEQQKRELYSSALCAEVGAGRAADVVERVRREAAGQDTLNQMMYVDTRLWLPDDLLLVGDKMSMAASVEMRVPFLDRQLVDLVESLPSDYKLRRGRRKALEKAALAPLLPRRIIHRRERGFATPIEAWLRTEMLPLARDALLSRDSLCAELFRPPALESLLRRHQSARFDHTRQIFCLLSLELWARQVLRPQAPAPAGRPAPT